METNGRPIEEPDAKCEACDVALDECDTCPACGVLHGDPCNECGQRGYHAHTCTTMADDAAYL
jgi:hypothetical protein